MVAFAISMSEYILGYLDQNNINTAGVNHLSKGRWKKLKEFVISKHLTIKWATALKMIP